jgi:hypothetical protein
MLRLVIISCGLAIGGAVHAHPLDPRCQQALNDIVAAKKKDTALVDWVEAHPRAPIRGAFSTVLDGCVAYMADDLRNDWSIYDLHNAMAREPNAEGADGPVWLLTCSRTSVSNALLDVVRKHSGNMKDVPLGDWVDDGAGGEPSLILKSETRRVNSREQCQTVFNKKADELKIPRWTEPLP